MSIIGSIIAGIIIGVLARLVLPGRQNISFLVTVVLGILGALIGWLVAGWLGVQTTSGPDWLRWIISIIVAALLIVGYERVMAGRTVGSRKA
ncbi:GlsB/YeaQ/YmgE family stress response membrane protein [Phycicoccus sp. HDW14]|uniref:GlsB/YeaQ/YmgE family stress response membrane protein n=1 Tax=Phycicoccus sp. HDW14 TaxID=2714941 RepID=UPI00140BC1F2|nr:GlsB/YeaQ/YmgE family stress response membrane protein [Phycicoccus sp. HDW14]QIM20235.1 GlsB/YeaQ/YmgE family stress response membrane protein [Phycicoccus sp. HDW14]